MKSSSFINRITFAWVLCISALLTNIAAQNKNAIIKLDYHNILLEDVFQDLMQKYGISIFYDDNEVKGIFISARCDSCTVPQAIDKILEKTPLIWDSIGVVKKPKGKPKDISFKGIIRGRVVNKENHEPLIDANVLLEGKKWIGAATDSSGNFIIRDLSEGIYFLIVRYQGFRNPHIKVRVKYTDTSFVLVELSQAPISMPVILVEGSSDFRLRPSEVRYPGMELDTPLPAGFENSERGINNTISRGGIPGIETHHFIDGIIPIDNPNIISSPVGPSGAVSLFPYYLIQRKVYHSSNQTPQLSNGNTSAIEYYLKEGSKDSVSGKLVSGYDRYGGMIGSPLPYNIGSFVLSGGYASSNELVESIRLDKKRTNIELLNFQNKLVIEPSPRHKISILNLLGDAKLSLGVNDYTNIKTYLGAISSKKQRKDNSGNSIITFSYMRTKHEGKLFNDWTKNFYSIKGFPNLPILPSSLEFQFNKNSYNVQIFQTGAFSTTKMLSYGLNAKLTNSERSYKYKFVTNKYHTPTTDSLTQLLPSKSNKFTSAKIGLYANYLNKLDDRFKINIGLKVDHYYENIGADGIYFSPLFSFEYLHRKTIMFTGQATLSYLYLSPISFSLSVAERLKFPLILHYVLGIQKSLTANSDLSLAIYNKSYKRFPLRYIQESKVAISVLDEFMYFWGPLFSLSDLRYKSEAFSRGIDLTIHFESGRRYFGALKVSYFRAKYKDLSGVWQPRPVDFQYTLGLFVKAQPSEKWTISCSYELIGGPPYIYCPVVSRDLKNCFSSGISRGRFNTSDFLSLRVNTHFRLLGLKTSIYLSVLNVLYPFGSVTVAAFDKSYDISSHNFWNELESLETAKKLNWQQTVVGLLWGIEVDL